MAALQRRRDGKGWEGTRRDGRKGKTGKEGKGSGVSDAKATREESWEGYAPLHIG